MEFFSRKDKIHSFSSKTKEMVRDVFSSFTLGQQYMKNIGSNTKQSLLSRALNYYQSEKKDLFKDMKQNIECSIAEFDNSIKNVKNVQIKLMSEMKDNLVKRIEISQEFNSLGLEDDLLDAGVDYSVYRSSSMLSKVPFGKTTGSILKLSTEVFRFFYNLDKFHSAREANENLPQDYYFYCEMQRDLDADSRAQLDARHYDICDVHGYFNYAN